MRFDAKSKTIFEARIIRILHAETMIIGSCFFQFLHFFETQRSFIVMDPWSEIDVFLSRHVKLSSRYLQQKTAMTGLNLLIN